MPSKEHLKIYFWKKISFWRHLPPKANPYKKTTTVTYLSHDTTLKKIKQYKYQKSTGNYLTNIQVHIHPHVNILFFNYSFFNKCLHTCACTHTELGTMHHSLEPCPNPILFCLQKLAYLNWYLSFQNSIFDYLFNVNSIILTYTILQLLFSTQYYVFWFTYVNISKCNYLILSDE